MRARAIIAGHLLPLLDAVIVAVVLARFWGGGFTGSRLELVWMLLTVPLLASSYRFFGLYESHRVEGVSGLLRSFLTAHLCAGLVLGVLLYLASSRPRYGALAAAMAVLAAVILAERWALYTLLQLARRGGYDIRSVCVLGRSERVFQMAERLQRHAEWGLHVACVGEGPPGDRRFCLYPSGTPLEGKLEEVLCSHAIDEVVISTSPEELAQETPVLQLCDLYGLLARVVLDTNHHPMRASSVEELHGEVNLSVGRPRRGERALLAKRALDILLAAGGLVSLAPFLVAIAILVKLSSAGPVIFRQCRVGLRGRKFTMFKFRTMVDGAEAMLPSIAHHNITRGPSFKDPNDCRITGIGRILRRFSLDELPQLVNVLCGQMSLVGPRPLPVHESNAISGEHRRRFSMRPGLTCLWQINGRSHVEYSTWMKYDLQYVDGWSLWMDAKVLVRTIPVVLTGKGAC